MSARQTTRLPLAAGQAPTSAIGWLTRDSQPFVLSGEWFGLHGHTILGSDPVRTADPRRDEPFALLSEQPDLSGPATIGGGWVGWLGYGLGALIEQLPAPPPAPVPRPGYWLGFYDHVLIHDGTRWWFEALGDPARSPRLAERLRVWSARLSPEPGKNGAPAPCSAEPAFALTGGGARAHMRAVTHCTERIAAGDLFQANLCLRLEAAFDGDPLALFTRALPVAKPRMGAYVDGVISLSPERFLRRDGRRVSTEPIKGTRPRTDDPGADAGARAELESSEKDAAELVMIVDLMRNDLGRVSRYGSVVAQAPRTEPHAGVWHTVASVSGLLRDEVDDAALLRATFPPGSVTGAPKVQAMKLITELESTRREAYTGAIGMVSPIAGLDLNVAIRTFETGGGRIWLGVGGGVVADSDPGGELAEALTKAAGPVAAVGGTITPPNDVDEPGPGDRVTPQWALGHGHRPNPDLGIFETILGQDGQAVAGELHLERLRASLSVLYGVVLSEAEIAALRAELGRAARAGTSGGGRTRIRIRASPSGELQVTHVPAETPHDADQPLTLVPFTLPGGLGAHKWQDRALIDALTTVAAGAVPLIVDSDGSVLEAGHANVWIVERGVPLTPPADGRILPGVTRAELLGSDPQAREERLTLERVQAAEAVFLTSSISGRRLARLPPPASTWT